MRHFLRYGVAALVVTMLAGGSALAEGRIATVDMRKVFEGYWKTKQARASMEERKAEMEKDHTTMMGDWKKLKEEYEAARVKAGDQAVSAEEHEKRQKTAEEKLKKVKDAEESLVSFEKTVRSTTEEQIRRMHDNILEEIRSVLSAKAKAAGYALVLDVAGDSVNGIPVVLYDSGENEITSAVLEQLNAAAPTPATSGTAAGAVKPDTK